MIARDGNARACLPDDSRVHEIVVNGRWISAPATRPREKTVSRWGASTPPPRDGGRVLAGSGPRWTTLSRKVPARRKFFG